MIYLIILFSLMVVVVSFVVIITFACWHDFNRCLSDVKPPRLKWDYIKQIYIINPEKWKNSYIYGLYYNGHQIRLSYIDYMKFAIAYIKHRKKENNKVSNKELRIILEEVQEDIDKFKENVL